MLTKKIEKQIVVLLMICSFLFVHTYAAKVNATYDSEDRSFKSNGIGKLKLNDKFGLF